jgi:hypothetical protein
VGARTGLWSAVGSFTNTTWSRDIADFWAPEGVISQMTDATRVRRAQIGGLPTTKEQPIVSIRYVTGALSERLGGAVDVSQGQDVFLHAAASGGRSRRLYDGARGFPTPAVGVRR